METRATRTVLFLVGVVSLIVLGLISCGEPKAVSEPKSGPAATMNRQATETALAVGSLDMTLGQGSRVAVNGTVAYVGPEIALQDPFEIYLVDISDPTNPRVVGVISLENGTWLNGMAFLGNYLYIPVGARGREYLYVVDISNPSAPQIVKRISEGGWDGPGNLVVSGNRGFTQWGGLRVLDLTNPTQPGVPQQGESIEGKVGDIAGNYVYLFHDYGLSAFFRVVDVSRTPREVGTLKLGGPSWDLAVSGNYAYFAEDGEGLTVIDISNPNNPVKVGHWKGRAYRVVAQGKYAYVTEDRGRLHIIDASDPTNPQEVGWYYAGRAINDVVVQGNYAYLAENEGFRIIDISDPSHPKPPSR